MFFFYLQGLFAGIRIGIFSALVLNSLFLFRSLREPVFLAYSLYVLALGTLISAAYGSLAVVWSATDGSSRFPILAALVLISAVSGAFFCIRFLQPKLRDPLILRSWRLHRATRIFAGAWAVLLIGFALQQASNREAVPAWLLTQATPLGGLLHVLLLALAMAERMRGLKREQQSFESRLENRVQQRTDELNLALSKVHRESELTRIELDIAAGIQKGIMPAASSRTATGETVTYLQSLAPVGGDYYDVFEFPENKSTAYLMADASGHGIPAALITTMAKICFMDATRKCGPDPRAILLDVNEAIARLIKTHEYLTAAVMVVDAQGAALYSSAGHRRSFHFERETRQVYSLDTEGILVGIYENSVIPAKIGRLNLRVSSGDRLLMFTDGFADVKNSRADRFGEERMEELLRDTAQLSLADAQSAILDVWREFQRHGSRDDDCTFTLIEFTLGERS